MLEGPATMMLSSCRCLFRVVPITGSKKGWPKYPASSSRPTVRHSPAEKVADASDVVDPKTTSRHFRQTYSHLPFTYLSRTNILFHPYPLHRCPESTNHRVFRGRATIHSHAFLGTVNRLPRVQRSMLSALSTHDQIIDATTNRD